MKDASVFRGTVVKGFVIRTKATGTKIEFIASQGDIEVKSLGVVAFTEQYVPCSENPAHTAKVWLSGTKKIREHARALLETISKTEYPMNQTAPATAPAAKTTAPAPTGKVGAGEPKAPKAAKTPKAPKLDKDGNPIPVKRKERPAKVAYTVEQKVTFVTTPNPKRAGSAAFGRFAKYAVGKTFTELLAAGLTRPDFAYNLSHGLIKAV